MNRIHVGIVKGWVKSKLTAAANLDPSASSLMPWWSRALGCSGPSLLSNLTWLVPLGPSPGRRDRPILPRHDALAQWILFTF
jgi:hypothetical protein